MNEGGITETPQTSKKIHSANLRDSHRKQQNQEELSVLLSEWLHQTTKWRTFSFSVSLCLWFPPVPEFKRGLRTWRSEEEVTTKERGKLHELCCEGTEGERVGEVSWTWTKRTQDARVLGRESLCRQQNSRDTLIFLVFAVFLLQVSLTLCFLEWRKEYFSVGSWVIASRRLPPSWLPVLTSLQHNFLDMWK
jgi:hypothetical protein